MLLKDLKKDFSFVYRSELASTELSDKYRTTQMIGIGSYGQVFQGHSKKKKEESFALKKSAPLKK